MLSAEPQLWTKLAPLPVPSGGFAAGAVSGRIITAGGITWRDGIKIWMNSIHLYDPDRNCWTEAGELPDGNAYSVFGTHGDLFVVAGGSNGKASAQQLVSIGVGAGPDARESAHITTQRTLRVTTRPLAVQSVYSGGAMIGDYLYVIAGARDSADLGTLSAVCHKINVITGALTNVPEYPGGAVMLPACATAGGNLYAFTGAHCETSATVANTGASYMYDVKAGTWKPIKPFPIAVRGLAACALDNERILLAGGYTDGFSDRTWIYDVRSDSYQEASRLPYAACVSLVKSGDYVYCLGGEDKMKHRTDAVYRAKFGDVLRGATR